MAVILEGYIKVPHEELETIKSKLNEHIQNTLNEDGCLEFDVTQDDGDECIFHVFEKFLDDDAFNRHIPRNRTLKTAIARAGADCGARRRWPVSNGQYYPV